MLAIALVLSLTSPLNTRHWRLVDVAEINHVCDPQGNIRFSQVILWRWQQWPTPNHYVSEFFIVTDQEILIEVKNSRRQITFHKGSVIYQASARTLKVSRTTHDPEMEDRKKLSMHQRKPWFPER
jgi:hypothetical protein